MFAKRHYEAIALAMQDAARQAEGVTNPKAVSTGVRVAVGNLADFFARDNGQFKRDRFIAACEPGANVKLRTNYKLRSKTNVAA